MEPNPTIRLSIVIDAIRKHRTALKYTNQFMAGKLSISVKTYRQIENGFTALSLERFAHIAQILDIHPFELLIPQAIEQPVLYKAS